MREQVSRLLTNVFLICLPGIALVGVYFWSDPFRVLWHYEDYSGTPVVLNRDFVSTEVLLNNLPKYRYNAFIFGNSRTLGFATKDWKPFLGDGAQIFHYDASAESLYGIHQKVQLLDRLGVQLADCLILLDASVLEKVGLDGSNLQMRDSDGHLYVKHPALSGRSPLEFQELFLQAYFHNHFYQDFICYLCSGSISTDGPARNLDDRDIQFQPISNDLILRGSDDELRTDEAGYYARRSSIFKNRPAAETTGSAVLSPSDQERFLRDIQGIFSRHGTRCVIVIPPLYDQIRFNPADLAVLKTLFGSDHVYDFSGVTTITQDMHNYYDNSHFKPKVGRSLLSSIYSHLKGQ